MRAFLRENIRSLNDSDIAVKNLYAFAEKGGTVILTNRSGVKNENNNCIMEQLPTVYKKLIGAHIEEYDPIGYNTTEANSIAANDVIFFAATVRKQ